jgi:Protein O-mannosyl-transferase TMEM260-like
VTGTRRPAWFVAVAVTLVCLVAYWLTRGKGPFWQDSGLFLAALHAGGGLLSPGYPLYLLLGRPFVALFHLVRPGATFAEAGNFFSSVWAALAAGLTTLSIAAALRPGNRFFAPRAPEELRSSRGPRRSPDPAALVAAVLGGLLAGLSYSLWFQALTAEAYALNAFFAALVLLLFLRLGDEGALGPTPTAR